MFRPKKFKSSAPPMVYFILALMASNGEFFGAQRATNFRANTVTLLNQQCITGALLVNLAHLGVCTDNFVVDVKATKFQTTA